MHIPVHIGIEHPSLLWIVAVGFLTFLAGLGVNLYRQGAEDVTAGMSDEQFD
ncbi:hypothetical protein [Haloplanus halobius]|uniref:hypothetical protein n=1 Tax=Haloplanus halobius TaxID=2934938 RepID=UPI00200FFE50|nr:hypothetical protein [Haloplanus sp. XH21]